VTDPSFYDGSCMLSMAAGAGAVWVTLETATSFGCD
jgi:hypothetical protein